MKKNYVSPFVQTVELENGTVLLAGSDVIDPSGPGTSTDSGSSASLFDEDVDW